MWANRSDEQLLSAVAREPAAFSAFYRRHVDDVLGFLARRCGDPEQAADLTAEVFATVLLQARRYKPERGTPTAWLFAIAAHKHSDAWRRAAAEDRARRRLGVRDVPLTGEDVAYIQARAGDVEALMGRPARRAAPRRPRARAGGPRLRRARARRRHLAGRRPPARQPRAGAAAHPTREGEPVTTFVDRLEDELIRAGYSRARRRGRAVAGLAGVAAIALVLAFALRTHAAPAPAPAATQCAPAARSNEPVDGRLLRVLAVLRAPARDSAGARCAESKAGEGPVYAGGTRYVGPGPLGGKVYLVPVVHWSSGAGTDSPKARRWRELPGACMVTVGGPKFDAAGLCASVREIPFAGAFVAAGVPAEGPLAADLRARGVPERYRRGTFVRLIVPDGVARVQMRFKVPGLTARAPVRANTAIAHVGIDPEETSDVTFAFFDAHGQRVKL